MSQQTVTVRHNFETAHRLPFLGGKCTSLHGHSWWAEVTVGGDVDDDGILVDFAALKRGLREWIDTYLDHGAMLGASDPLVGALEAAGSKTFVFGWPGAVDWTGGDPWDGRALAWPTVENVAELLRRVTSTLLRALELDVDALSIDVQVTETATNRASAHQPAAARAGVLA